MMKVIEKVSNTATISMTTTRINMAGFSAKKFCLPLLFGASLIYMGNPPHAGERQGTKSQGSGRGTMPAPGYTDDRVRNQDSNTLERGGERMEQMEQDTDRPGGEERSREPIPSGERGISPDTGRDTTPGEDPMDRDTGTGGQGPNRETAPRQ